MGIHPVCEMVLSERARSTFWPPVEEPAKAVGSPREATFGRRWSRTVAAVVAALPEEAWEPLTVSEGEKGTADV
jgi:hypothetical protein